MIGEGPGAMSPSISRYPVYPSEGPKPPNIPISRHLKFKIFQYSDIPILRIWAQNERRIELKKPADKNPHKFLSNSTPPPPELLFKIRAV